MEFGAEKEVKRKSTLLGFTSFNPYSELLLHSLTRLIVSPKVMLQPMVIKSLNSGVSIPKESLAPFGD